MNFHNSTTCPPWYFRAPECFIDALVIRSTAQFVSVSKNCLDSLKTRRIFAGCGKLSYIYNGIKDPTPYLSSTSFSSKSYSVSERYCLMLATYELRKGHEYILQAFQFVVKDFPSVRLQIYGHGLPHEKKRVADEVQRLKLEKNVFLGNFTVETAALLSGASVLVVPSQAYESFGLTIIEAMAFGIPVVTTDVGGMPEVLAGSKAGIVCSKDDPLSFAEAIKSILGNPRLAVELGQNGRQTFLKRFTASTMARQYESIIKQ